jgi:hypothetical protein
MSKMGERRRSVNLVHFLPEQRRSCHNGTRLKRNKTKGTMNETRLKQSEISKNLSLAERRKSRPNGTRLKQNQTKGMMNKNKTDGVIFPRI